MDKGKIVALEDRIPKLKEQRRRKANKRLILLLFLFFLMIAVVAYVQSPLSHVKKITVKGNELLTDSEIINLTKISKETNIWSVNEKEISSKLREITEIKEAEVIINWPNNVVIQMTEHKIKGYIQKDKKYFPILENAVILTNRELEGISFSAPILFNFKEDHILKEMIFGLDELSDEIGNSISEIHYTPKKTDDYHITLYMNDGFEVNATLRSFSEKMAHYPSIISQLDPNKKGIIDLEVGSFFRAFEEEAEESDVEKDKGEG